MVYRTAGIVPISNIKMGKKTKWKQEGWVCGGVGGRTTCFQRWLFGWHPFLFWNSHKNETFLVNIVCIWQMKSHPRPKYNQSGKILIIILIIGVLKVFGMIHEDQSKDTSILKSTDYKVNEYRVKNWSTHLISRISVSRPKEAAATLKVLGGGGLVKVVIMQWTA